MNRAQVAILAALDRHPQLRDRPCSHSQAGGIEYAYDSPVHYDGISEWSCPDCGIRVGRWTRRVLEDGEVEPPFGGR